MKKNKVKYNIVLVLANKSYIDLSDVNNLINNKRNFTIFKWDYKFTYKKQIKSIQPNNCGNGKIEMIDDICSYGGYVPWLHYNGYKWTKMSEKEGFMKHLKDPRQVMISGHMSFETEDDFKTWLGENLEDVIADLL